MTSFYSEALLWFTHLNNTDIGLSNKQKAFIDIPDLKQLTDYQRRRLHLFVILLKQYIYASKCLGNNLSRNEFQRRVLLQWQIEKRAFP